MTGQTKEDRTPSHRNFRTEAGKFVLVSAAAVLSVAGLRSFTTTALQSGLGDAIAPVAVPVRSVRRSPASPLTPVLRPEERQPTACERARAEDSEPYNGEELERHDRSGVGILEINNGTRYPGVGVLIDMSTRRPFRAMYVEASSSAKMLQVNPGDYRLQFALGRTWLDSEGRFCRTIGVSEFEQPLRFAEEMTHKGLLYDVIEVTFHKLEGGNARTRDLPPEAFALTLAAGREE